MTGPSDPWALLLDRDETLVWTGRPATDWRFRKQDWVLFVIGGALVGLCGLVFLSDARDEAPAWFLIFAAALGVLGSGLIPFVMWKERARRRRTWYGLTERRAMILEGRMLRSFPLAETNRLDIVSYGTRKSVFFKDEYLTEALMRNGKVPPIEIGFEWIADGTEVHDHLRRLGAGRSQDIAGRTRGAPV